MTETPPTVLVVEDEDRIRKFLRLSLEAHGYRVIEERLAAAALQRCVEGAPDLVILDLGLPDMDGRDFIARLREWSATPVIVLSVRAREEDKVQCLDTGANDYVTKPFGIGELMARIRVVLRNAVQGGGPPQAFSCHGLRVDLAARAVSVDGASVHLSRKEFALLRLLISHAGQVLTHRHILGEVWGSGREDQAHYLRVLIGQLRQKLGDDPARPTYIFTEQGVGYRFRAPD